jgi:predicted small lipoprotein YifL
LKKVPVKYSIFACLMTVIFFTGCGLKGNPVSLSAASDHRQSVQNMKAVSSGDAVILKWDYYDKDVKINYIAIERSEVGSAGNECKDCPRTFERIGQVPVKGIIIKNKESNTLSFTDKKIVRGKIYNYRLMLCYDSGVCLEGSAAEINFK